VLRGVTNSAIKTNKESWDSTQDEILPEAPGVPYVPDWLTLPAYWDTPSATMS
jgi:hypothetical protein